MPAASRPVNGSPSSAQARKTPPTGMSSVTSMVFVPPARAIKAKKMT